MQLDLKKVPFRHLSRHMVYEKKPRCRLGKRLYLALIRGRYFLSADPAGPQKALLKLLPPGKIAKFYLPSQPFHIQLQTDTGEVILS